MDGGKREKKACLLHESHHRKITSKGVRQGQGDHQEKLFMHSPPTRLCSATYSQTCHSVSQSASSSHGTPLLLHAGPFNPVAAMTSRAPALIGQTPKLARQTQGSDWPRFRESPPPTSFFFSKPGPAFMFIAKHEDPISMFLQARCIRQKHS